VITIHQRYRQTDRQTTCDRNTALCTKVHRAVKSLAKAKVSARQRCVYEGPLWRRNLRQINARCIRLKSTFSGLQRCRRQYGSYFIRLAAAFQICKITRNSPKNRICSSSRSSKVIDLGANRKRMCNFLLVINIG